MRASTVSCSARLANATPAWPTTAEQAGRATSAASLRLRAAEYYRQAFFWHRDDLDGKELTTAYRASVDTFHRALPACHGPAA
jgi:hypothetical protein